MLTHTSTFFRLIVPLKSVRSLQVFRKCPRSQRRVHGHWTVDTQFFKIQYHTNYNYRYFYLQSSVCVVNDYADACQRSQRLPGHMFFANIFATTKNFAKPFLPAQTVEFNCPPINPTPRPLPCLLIKSFCYDNSTLQYSTCL